MYGLSTHFMLIFIFSSHLPCLKKSGNLTLEFLTKLIPILKKALFLSMPSKILKKLKAYLMFKTSWMKSMLRRQFTNLSGKFRIKLEKNSLLNF